MLSSFVSHASRSCARFVLLALTVPLTVVSAAAQQPPPPAPPAFVAGTLPDNSDPPVIDGRVDDAVWQGVKPYTDFIQQDPTEGAPASERTEVRLIVGRGNVYVGIICFDSDPSKIIVSQARRDASLDRHRLGDHGLRHVQRQPERVRVRHQPARHRVRRSGGARRADERHHLRRGRRQRRATQRGGISAFNPNWDGDWTVKSQVTDRGWEAEMAIPLKTLRYATGANKTWGFNVLRNIRHKNEQVYLAPIPRGFDIYRVSLAAKVSGLNLPARRDIKVIPYALGSANKDYTRPRRRSTRQGRPTSAST